MTIGVTLNTVLIAIEISEMRPPRLKPGRVRTRLPRTNRKKCDRRIKLTDDEVEEILALREHGLTYREIAEKYDDREPVSPETVKKICLGRRRTNRGKR